MAVPEAVAHLNRDDSRASADLGSGALTQREQCGIQDGPTKAYRRRPAGAIVAVGQPEGRARGCLDAHRREAPGGTLERRLIETEAAQLHQSGRRAEDPAGPPAPGPLSFKDEDLAARSRETSRDRRPCQAAPDDRDFDA